MRRRRFSEAPSVVTPAQAHAARVLRQEDVFGGKPPMTDRQRAFLLTLLETRDIDDERRDLLRGRVLDGLVTKELASTWIERLLAKPILHRAQEQSRFLPYEAVPPGRYALRSADGERVSFYKVDRPREGRWAGRVFVQQLIANGGHGYESLSERRIPFPMSAEIVNRIYENDAKESAMLFGKLLGTCGVCGRVLTNQESREKGIGPVCEDNWAVMELS